MPCLCGRAPSRRSSSTSILDPDPGPRPGHGILGSMADTSQLTGSLQPQPGTYNPIAHVHFPVGTVVTPLSLDGQVGLASAGAITTASTSGIAATPGVAGGRANVRFSGLVTLTPEEWDAVTGGSGGLLAGSTYFVSDSIPGQITFSRPTTPGHFVTQIGLALSPTDLLVQIGPAEGIA